MITRGNFNLKSPILTYQTVSHSFGLATVAHVTPGIQCAHAEHLTH